MLACLADESLYVSRVPLKYETALQFKIEQLKNNQENTSSNLQATG